jgi:hypothetical protein
MDSEVVDRMQEIDLVAALQADAGASESSYDKAVRVFEQHATLVAASARLRTNGFEDRARGLDIVADALLDGALEIGLDYELVLQEQVAEIVPAGTEVVEGGSKSHLQWVCCSDPRLQRTKKGKRVWLATCKYKSKGHTRAMTRVVGKNPRVKPNKVMLGGKPMPACTT